MAKQSVNIPTFKLNNGQEIPAIAFGTWLGVSAKPQEKSSSDSVFSFEYDGADIPRLVDALAAAIDAGYRHVDTAHVYRVEPEVGRVINDKIRQGVVTREDIFLTTKVWQHLHRAGDVEVALRGSLRRLALHHVDMLLVHWPMAVSQEGVDEKIDYLDTWRGFEAVLAKGLTKGIGVSNFNLEQMKRLLANCKVKPAINQIEINLNLGQSELVEYCHANGVQIEAYSPLGTMIPDRAVPDSPEPKLNNPTLLGIANKYNKSVTQVAFRYLYQRGLVLVPKTITPSRLVENASIFDFHLEQEDVDAIAKFDVGYRTVRPIFYQEYTNYPFDKVPGKMDVPLSMRKWKNGANFDIE